MNKSLLTLILTFSALISSQAHRKIRLYTACDASKQLLSTIYQITDSCEVSISDCGGPTGEPDDCYENNQGLNIDCECIDDGELPVFQDHEEKVYHLYQKYIYEDNTCFDETIQDTSYDIMGTPGYCNLNRKHYCTDSMQSVRATYADSNCNTLQEITIYEPVCNPYIDDDHNALPICFFESDRVDDMSGIKIYRPPSFQVTNYVESCDDKYNNVWSRWVGRGICDEFFCNNWCLNPDPEFGINTARSCQCVDDINEWQETWSPRAEEIPSVALNLTVYHHEDSCDSPISTTYQFEERSLLQGGCYRSPRNTGMRVYCLEHSIVFEYYEHDNEQEEAYQARFQEAISIDAVINPADNEGLCQTLVEAHAFHRFEDHSENRNLCMHFSSFKSTFSCDYVDTVPDDHLPREERANWVGAGEQVGEDDSGSIIVFRLAILIVTILLL